MQLTNKKDISKKKISYKKFIKDIYFFNFIDFFLVRKIFF